MESPKPQLNLAEKVLPPGLYKAIIHVFSQGLEESMLVGGTALSGFYAGHRHSDDIDIFTRTSESQEWTVRAVQSLRSIGATFDQEKRTPAYYRATLRLMKHAFTADIVLDPHLFEVGHSIRLENGIAVADFTTLLMMKSATLVSRCSEKDIYDLIWILSKHPNIRLEEFIELGHHLDGGLDAESLLISLSGAKPNPEACGFTLHPKINPKKTCQQIEAFRRGLIKNLMSLAKNQPVPPLGELIQFVKTIV